jgi:hypothetical protein
MGVSIAAGSKRRAWAALGITTKAAPTRSDLVEEPLDPVLYMAEGRRAFPGPRIDLTDPRC